MGVLPRKNGLCDGIRMIAGVMRPEAPFVRNRADCQSRKQRFQALCF